MTLEFLLVLAGLGFAGAFVGGLVGVGGAVIMLPALYYVPPLLGVGSLELRLVAGVTMAQVLSAAVLGAWVHGRVETLDRSLLLVAGGAMAAGSLAGGVASGFVEGRVLLVVFGLMGALALPLMYRRPAPAGAAPGPARFDRRGAVAYPGLIGVAAGLVGAGGAFLLVPVLTGLLRLPLRAAIGSSLAITTVSAVGGFTGKLLTRQVPLWPTVAVLAGSVTGAPLGAWLSRMAPTGVLRNLLALIIAAATLRVWADVLLGE